MSLATAVLPMPPRQAGISILPTPNMARRMRLKRHVGDLGNVVADDTGHAHYERVDAIIKLNGPNSIIGHAMIVHANPDDFITQPTGNAGGRVACGIIAER